MTDIDALVIGGGQASFAGAMLHAADYREPTIYTGQRVVVVGAANSAVQIAVELAAHATVTLATRAPVRLPPQRPFGRDIHFWSAVTGLDALPTTHRGLAFVGME